MRAFDVTIRATVTKTIRVEADSIDDAYTEAHGQFCVENIDSAEDYDQETLSVKEVQS